MDVQIDCGAIYFGLKQIKNIESYLSSLSSAMSGVTLPSELTTASLLSDAKTKVSSIINGDIKELIEIFEESKNILTQSDNHAALLFQYYEEGIIDEEGNFTDVPLLTQNDYSYITYGGNNVATSGCGITSLCMVASYIMDRLYTPEDLAAIANADKSSNVGKMTTAADYVGLNWFCDKTTSKEDLVNYLNEGKLVICLVKSSSHFVVCKGISEDGQILVNDPYLNYRNSATADGCTWSELQFSAGQTWVFDPAANTNATTSAGEITISEDVLKRLQNIEIDGVYEATVEADTNTQNSISQDTTKDDTTSQEPTNQDITTQDTTTQDTSQTNNNEDKTQSEDTNQTNDTTSNTKDWANQSSNNNSTTTNNTTNTNTSNSSNNQNNSNNSSSTSSSTSNNTSNSNNSSTSSNSSSENNSNTSNSTTEDTTQSSSNSSASDTKTETSTTDKTDTSTKNETTTGSTSVNSSTSNNQNNTIGKVETTNKVDHSTSTDSSVIDELISSTEGLNNNSTAGNSSNNNNSNTPKPDTTTNTNTEAIPDTRVDKPQIKHKNKKTFEPIINPAFIGATLATLSVGAITVAERDKKNKKKTQN